MSAPDEFRFVDAMGLADLIKKKEVRPVELVDAAITRIERLNPLLNAVITPMYEQGRSAAQGKVPGGPFPGVPFLIKDIGVALAGVRMTMGSAFLKLLFPTTTANWCSG